MVVKVWLFLNWSFTEGFAAADKSVLDFSQTRWRV